MSREYPSLMRKSATILAILGAIFFTTPAFAETSESATETSVTALATPEPRDAHGREIREPQEHNEHERNGLEGESLIIVIGALIIAVGLAYGIGRRSRKP